MGKDTRIPSGCNSDTGMIYKLIYKTLISFTL